MNTQPMNKTMWPKYLCSFLFKVIKIKNMFKYFQNHVLAMWLYIDQTHSIDGHALWLNAWAHRRFFMLDREPG